MVDVMGDRAFKMHDLSKGGLLVGLMDEVGQDKEHLEQCMPRVFGSWVEC